MTAEYVAGLIDGEGYFGLLPNKHRQLKVKSFSPVFKIAMTGSTAELIMYDLQERYGGGYVTKRTNLTKGRRVVWTYTAKSRRQVRAVLDDVQPHLRVKAEQAELLAEFCRLPSSHSLYRTFSESVQGRKQWIYQELKRLKRPESLVTTE